MIAYAIDPCGSTSTLKSSVSKRAVSAVQVLDRTYDHRYRSCFLVYLYGPARGQHDTESPARICDSEPAQVQRHPDGGEFTLSREDLIRDSTRGPLRTYVERAVQLKDADAACRYLLCSASMRTLVTPRSFARVAVDASAEGAASSIAFKIMAEPNATAIVALEFRHSVSA